MLIQTIKNDQLEARKNKLPSAKLLTTLLGEAQKIGKDDGNRETTDAEVMKLIEKFIKNNQDTMSRLERTDARCNELAGEIEILMEYMPSQLTESEMKGIITELIYSNMTNIGQIMKHFKENYSGSYDGKVLSKLVKDAL